MSARDDEIILQLIRERDEARRIADQWGVIFEPDEDGCSLIPAPEDAYTSGWAEDDATVWDSVQPTVAQLKAVQAAREAWLSRSWVPQRVP